MQRPGWLLLPQRKDSVSSHSACFQHRFAATCQTVGMNIGYFASFTVFLALNDASFCNKYLRSEPNVHGLLRLSGYMRFWGWVYLVVTALLVLFKREVNFRRPGNPAIPGCCVPIWELHSASHAPVLQAVRPGHGLHLCPDFACWGMAHVQVGSTATAFTPVASIMHTDAPAPFSWSEPSCQHREGSPWCRARCGRGG